MAEWVPGVLVGLGFFVLIPTARTNPLIRRLRPYLEDIALPNIGSVDDGPLRVLRAMIGRSRDARSVWRLHRNSRSIDDEMAGFLDVVGLCLSAGVSVPDALHRIGERGDGILAHECRLISREVELGVSVEAALHASDRRLRNDAWSRFLEHLVAARRSGTPLSELVRALADDEANASGRRLVESASLRETLMMFPLVFVILPVTVMIAVFPGVTALGGLT